MSSGFTNWEVLLMLKLLHPSQILTNSMQTLNPTNTARDIPVQLFLLVASSHQLLNRSVNLDHLVCRGQEYPQRRIPVCINGSNLNGLGCRLTVTVFFDWRKWERASWVQKYREIWGYYILLRLTSIYWEGVLVPSSFRWPLHKREVLSTEKGDLHLHIYW